jgi:hypothetical protein
MQAYDPSNNEQRKFLEDNIADLQKANNFLAEVTLMKEEIIKNIIGALQHTHEGQRTYEYGTWKVEVKTPFIYSLNKKLYESKSIFIPSQFNPIKESIAYVIDKNLCDKFMEEAPKKVRSALAELIDKKPGKPSIVVKERI